MTRFNVSMLTSCSARPCNIHSSIHPLLTSTSTRPHSSSTAIHPLSSSPPVHSLSSSTLITQPRQQTANMISHILLVLITIFLPPLGVFMIAGCGADFLINLCLTLLGCVTLFFCFFHCWTITDNGIASSLVTSTPSTSNTSTITDRNRATQASLTTAEHQVSTATTFRLAVAVTAPCLLPQLALM